MKITVILYVYLRGVCGDYQQHEGEPYCNKPCYAALFGPGGMYYVMQCEFAAASPGFGSRGTNQGTETETSKGVDWTSNGRDIPLSAA